MQLKDFAIVTDLTNGIDDSDETLYIQVSNQNILHANNFWCR